MKYPATALGVIMRRGDILIAAVAFPIAAAWAQSASPRLVKPESEPKTTDQAYKNIQVLKDLPADQLIPAMQFVASSLGVECEFCHVESAFDKDEKKPKQTARKMMRMMFAINKDNFDGHREVTCYSCHRGARKPVGIPIIGDEEPKIEVAMDMTSEETNAAIPDVARLPAVDQILAKHVQALGGEDAIRKVSSRIEKGTITAFGGHQFPVEVFAKAPDKRVFVMHLPNGDSITAFDGHVGWIGAPGRPVREMSGGELEGAKLDADFFFPLRLKEMFTKLESEQAVKIGDHEVNVVSGFADNQPVLRLYFDMQSGLLLRSVRYAESPLGRNPTRIDYADYRKEGGVKIPFRWTVARPSGRFTIQLTEVEQDIPIDDGRFSKPGKPIAAGKP
jgi:photosynthetic reaction center cytochrome c subunit